MGLGGCCAWGAGAGLSVRCLAWGVGADFWEPVLKVGFVDAGRSGFAGAVGLAVGVDGGLGAGVAGGVGAGADVGAAVRGVSLAGVPTLQDAGFHSWPRVHS